MILSLSISLNACTCQYQVTTQYLQKRSHCINILCDIFCRLPTAVGPFSRVLWRAYTMKNYPIYVEKRLLLLNCINTQCVLRHLSPCRACAHGMVHDTSVSKPYICFYNKVDAWLSIFSIVCVFVCVETGFVNFEEFCGFLTFVRNRWKMC